ncbi:MAG: hypothetical protein WCC66_13480 [Rhizobiaceae bacterium]
MRMKFSVVAAMFAATLVSGCNTVSESEYKVGQAALSESPSAKRYVLQECIAETRPGSASEQKELAAFLKVPQSKLTETICRRVVNAMASGRMSYADYRKIVTTGDSPKLLKIIQGK